jgi:hypothetical protein
MFEYQADTSVFIVSGSNDAPLPDTNRQPMTSGIANDRLFVVPLVNGCILVLGRGASLLPDTVKTEASPRYSNNAMKLYAPLVLHVSSYWICAPSIMVHT